MGLGQGRDSLKVLCLCRDQGGRIAYILKLRSKPPGKAPVTAEGAQQGIPPHYS